MSYITLAFCLLLSIFKRDSSSRSTTSRPEQYAHKTSNWWTWMQLSWVVARNSCTISTHLGWMNRVPIVYPPVAVDILSFSLWWRYVVSGSRGIFFWSFLFFVTYPSNGSSSSRVMSGYWAKCLAELSAACLAPDRKMDIFYCMQAKPHCKNKYKMLSRLKFILG